MLRNIRIREKRKERKESLAVRKVFTLGLLWCFSNGLPRSNILNGQFLRARLLNEVRDPALEPCSHVEVFSPFLEFLLLLRELVFEIF